MKSKLQSFWLQIEQLSSVVMFPPVVKLPLEAATERNWGIKWGLRLGWDRLSGTGVATAQKIVQRPNNSMTCSNSAQID